jgi:hypothetical protein
VAMGDVAGSRVGRVFELRRKVVDRHELLASRSPRPLGQPWPRCVTLVSVNNTRRRPASGCSHGVVVLDTVRAVAICSWPPAHKWFQCISFHSVHPARRLSGLKPILKPTGCESMLPRANRRAVLDLGIDGRRPPATPEFESPLPHPLEWARPLRDLRTGTGRNAPKTSIATARSPCPSTWMKQCHLVP